MPLAHYGALVGTITAKLDSPAAMLKNPGSKPHYQILVSALNVNYRIAVNVKSNQQPSDLQYYLDDNFKHPILTHIQALPVGFGLLPKTPNTAALDYIRGNLFKIADMRIMPTILEGPNNDLNDIIDVHVRHAMESPGALVYAFGERWGPENQASDKYFDFEPGNGIHDIHMNQGNTGAFAKDNGVYQDGGFFIHFPEEDRWVAMFLKFQSQVVHTDDGTADPIEPPEDEPVLPEEDTAIKIFAAMVNPKGDDVGDEFVYLLNTTDKDINLGGWAIADKLKKKEPIPATTIKAGDVCKITLSGKTAQLGNKGGIITLLNKEGLKIDGVSYTQQQVSKQGFVIAF